MAAGGRDPHWRRVDGGRVYWAVGAAAGVARKRRQPVVGAAGVVEALQH